VKVCVASGGVGAARFLRALQEVVPGTDTTAIVNTGDDVVLYGLHISPDLDTVTYTLAGAIDERGWGLAGEQWAAMEALARYDTPWFNLGDRDLATHMYRTARLAEGATLTAATAEIAASWGLDQRLLPMTDQPVATMITLAGGEEVSFQEYFVRRRHGVPVSAVRFAGASAATLGEAAAEALRGDDVVVIAPSNPLVSIGPLRALAGVDELLAARRESVVAISPIVGGVALKGPADRMLVELGHEASVIGVARLYAPIAAALVIDPADAHLAGAVEAEGIRAVVTRSVMSEPGVGARLAEAVLAAADD
jgi:LPPG:FO 2-phospho-L-lactate transferase